ncbi:MAG: PQQ-like beta-propeller repeat protein [Bacteroidales bacterium]|nr:PQQ-like beta-propeller repeat protein [Bacteroidales bacterium]
MSKLKKVIENVRLWKGVAIVAGVYSFIFCVLIIANFTQINRVDPVNTKVLNTLVERLKENPNDNQLREEIRELDLLARKAYFTNQWQIKNGGYMLMIGVLVLIIALQFIRLATKGLPVVDNENDDKLLYTQNKARKWISIGGATLVVVALVFAFLTQNQLKSTFINAAQASNNEEKSQVSNSPVVQETTQAKVVETPKNVTAEVTDANKEKKLEVTTSKEEKKEQVQQPQVSNQVVTAANYPSDNELKNNFPNFRGFGGNAIAYQKNIPVSWDGSSGQNVLWKVAIPLPGYNSPVIWGDKIFVAGANASKREVYCFERNSGKLLWIANADNIQGSPLKAPDVQGDTGQSAPTISTDGKRVYVIFANGDIMAVDMNGTRVWAKNLGVPQNHYGHSSSLIAYKNLVIVQYDQRTNPRVLALSSATGDEVWSTPRKVKISWSSPIIVNTGIRAELMLVAEPSVSSYDPTTGKQLWSIDCISGEVGPSLAYADGVVFALNEYASLTAIKVGNTPQKLWESSDYLSDVPSPVATDKYLFVVTSYGTVVCYDAKTGTSYWTKEFENGFYSSPVIAEDKVYLMDKQGTMHIFKADKVYASLGEPKLGEKTVTTPAFANGRIYIRGDKNLYCIGK